MRYMRDQQSFIPIKIVNLQFPNNPLHDTKLFSTLASAKGTRQLTHIVKSLHEGNEEYDRRQSLIKQYQE
jgi:hypothetical protein